jgi:serine/threonine-protein kinase
VPPVVPGEVVAEKYRVDGMIGFGGMGIVCAGTHIELHTPIAIKFVRPERGVDERAVARFLTEARAAAQLRSQHACRVMDCGKLPGGTPYIVMELLVGADLRTIMMRSGPLPIAVAVEYAKQACEALAEAHSKHIVHRDIKPENLFLTEGPAGTPCLKVLDFGISKQGGPLGAERSITEPTENMGSPFYMSPEQMIDPAGVDSRTDIWSLGVVLYELVTGQLPFSGETTPQLCANVMTTQPLPPQEHRADIPDGLSGVILRCIEKDRQRRFRDVGQLLAALEPVATNDAGPESSAESVGVIPGLPRRGFGLRISVVLVLLLATGLAVYAARRAWNRPESAPATSADTLPPAPSVSAAPAPLPAVPSATSSASNASKPNKHGPSKAVSTAASAAPQVKAPPANVVPTSTPEPAPAPTSPSESVVYPEMKPIPEMAPPAAP